VKNFILTADELYRDHLAVTGYWVNSAYRCPILYTYPFLPFPGVQVPFCVKLAVARGVATGGGYIGM